MRQFTNRQGTKNCPKRSKGYGDFGNILALFASLAVHKNNTQEGTILL
jgi:hypothetical protein